MRVKPSLPLLAAALLASALVPGHAQQRSARVVSAAPSNGGAYYALVVGNDDYASLPKLKTAAADAREVERVLRESYGFQTRLLLNAGRARIVAALSAYRRELGANASLLVYYAGHGYDDRDADKAYWLPVDASPDDVSNWIIADEITTAARVIPARHVLVVSDSCYSGMLTRGLGVSPSRPAEREQFLQKMSAGRSRTLMASGGDEPVADGGGSGHSVFASALLSGLRQMDKPRFTASELFNGYIVEPVAGRADQTPVYNPLRNSGHESGDFVFTKMKAVGETVGATSGAPPASADPARRELAFWTSIQNSTDAEDFRDYLARYPDGLYAGIARRRVQAMNSKSSQPVPEQKTSIPDAPLASNQTVTFRFDGLYRCNKLLRTAWLRFYEDGTVLTVTTEPATAKEAGIIAKWFEKDSGNKAFRRGAYKYTGTGVRDVGISVRLTFPSAFYGKQFECTGTLSSDGLSFRVDADLGSERIIEGNSVYEFIKLGGHR